MAPVQIARVQPVVTFRGYNPWSQSVVVPLTFSAKIKFFEKKNVFALTSFFHFITYFLWSKIVKNNRVLFSWIIPFHRHPTRHILKILIFGGVLAGFWGVPLVKKFFKYKLDTPRLIMSHCAKFHNPSYLGTPLK